jgi:hypothetical protein
VRRIHILVEGQTEEIVVREVIAPALAPDIWLQPVLLTTKRLAGAPNHKGGVSTWTKIEKDIRLLLRDSSASHVTTLLDYYGLSRHARASERHRIRARRLRGRTDVPGGRREQIRPAPGIARN